MNVQEMQLSMGDWKSLQTRSERMLNDTRRNEILMNENAGAALFQEQKPHSCACLQASHPRLMLGVDASHGTPDRAVALEARAESNLPDPVPLSHALGALNLRQNVPTKQRALSTAIGMRSNVA